jgi:hydroxymethylpyrimidine kinase/phosphomethylpyrimidine kinase
MGVTVVCSIGTTHPWNIAGVGLDARVAAHLGARHVAVVAGVSAQGTGIAARAPVAPELIREQLRSAQAAAIDAYCIGALLAPESVAVVAETLAARKVPVVCDPVIATSSGFVLADAPTVAALRTQLFRVCTLVTPNLAEASQLCDFPVNDRATMSGAAHTLVERDGATAALVTGGHLEGEATDVLYAAGRTTELEGTKLSGGMRGTGCVLATAAAIALARGENIVDAVGAARALVRDAIAHAAEWSGERVWPW